MSGMDGVSMDSMNDEGVAQRMGDYEILELIGVGGMGKVFKARNVISNRVEALKIILPDLADRQDRADRFRREIQLLASLEHPNIAALRTAFTVDNQLVMVMEFVEGVTLSVRQRKGPIPIVEAVGYIDQALNALGYAHARHIIHRDVKPANMMLTPKGVLKLMDFGIARADDAPGMTKTGSSIGSFGYMSPEQIRGERVDARSDLYSVAASLYEFVTGKSPFQGDNAHAIMTAHMKNDPTPPIKIQPNLPQALNDTILRGLATNPNDRFQSADDFRNALKHVLQVSQDCSDAMATPPPIIELDTPTLMESETRTTETVIDPKAKDIVSEPPTSPHKLHEAKPLTPPPLSDPPPLRKKPTSHRGLYMTLGAIAIAAVIAVVLLGKQCNPWSDLNKQFQNISTKFDHLENRPNYIAIGADTDMAKRIRENLANAKQEIKAQNDVDKARLCLDAAESGVKELKQTLDKNEEQIENLSREAAKIRNEFDSIKDCPDCAKSADIATRITENFDNAKRAINAWNVKDAQRYIESAKYGVEELRLIKPDPSCDLKERFKKLSDEAAKSRKELTRLRECANYAGGAAIESRLTDNLNSARKALDANDCNNVQYYLNLTESDIKELNQFIRDNSCDSREQLRRKLLEEVSELNNKLISIIKKSPDYAKCAGVEKRIRENLDNARQELNAKSVDFEKTRQYLAKTESDLEELKECVNDRRNVVLPCPPELIPDLKDQLIKLSSRANAMSDSVEELRKNIKIGAIRSDIAAAEKRMKAYLEEAHRALAACDVENTRRYMKLAETEVETLEWFFGRR